MLFDQVSSSVCFIADQLKKIHFNSLIEETEINPIMQIGVSLLGLGFVLRKKYTLVYRDSEVFGIHWLIRIYSK